jgi:hypothetical protein
MVPYYKGHLITQANSVDVYIYNVNKVITHCSTWCAHPHKSDRGGIGRGGHNHHLGCGKLLS